MSGPGGWLGNGQQLQHFLGVVGADRDPDGKWIIGGGAVAIMGNDVVIGPEAVYFVDGAPHGLANDLRGTSYGLAVGVIMAAPEEEPE